MGTQMVKGKALRASVAAVALVALSCWPMQALALDTNDSPKQTAGEPRLVGGTKEAPAKNDQAPEKRGAVEPPKAGTGGWVRVDPESIAFDNGNVKKGAFVTVDNKSAVHQTIGILFPEEGLLFRQVYRKSDQQKIPVHDWQRFIVPPDDGIIIVIVPDINQPQLKMLDGKQIVIRIYQGEVVRDVFRIPLKVSPDLKSGAHMPGQPVLQSAGRTCPHNRF